jgi:predicted cupin superfamily sugar epimerase
LGPRQTTTSQPGSQGDNTDRRSNLIIFGVAEDRDISVWHNAVDKILNFVAGRPVETMDMFRLGRYINGVNRKPRPILFKLRIT